MEYKDYPLHWMSTPNNRQFCIMYDVNIDGIFYITTDNEILPEKVYWLDPTADQSGNEIRTIKEMR